MRNTRGAVPLVATVVIGLILVAGAVFLFATPKGEEVIGFLSEAVPLQAPTGVTTLSMGQVEFFTDDPILKGETWVVHFRSGGLGQNIRGTKSVNPSMMTLNDGTRPTKSFTFDMWVEENRLEYPITGIYKSEPIYFYGYTDYGGALTNKLSPTEIWNDCNQNYGQVVKVSKEPLFAGNHEYCVYRRPVTSPVRSLKTQPDDIFKAKVKLDIQGETPSTGEISNKANPTVQLGGYGYVHYLGNLVSGETPPSATDFIQSPLAVYYQGSWRLISKLSYDVVPSSYRNKLPSPSDFEGKDLSVIKSDTSTITNIAKIALEEVGTSSEPLSYAGKNWIVKWQYKTNENQGLPYLEQDKSLQFPTFVLYIKADTMGVYQPVGIPKIISASPISFGAEGVGTITATIKNVGDQRGTFTIWADCNAPAQQQGANIEKSFSPGEQLSVQIPIVGDTNKPVDTSCVVHAKMLSKEDTMSVPVHIDPGVVCTANQQVCLEGKAQECNEFGSAYEIIEDCLAKGKQCFIENGKAVCKEELPTLPSILDKDKEEVTPPTTPPETPLEACYRGVEAQYTGLAKLSPSNQLSIIGGKIKCWFAFKSALFIAGFFGGLVLAVALSIKRVLAFIPSPLFGIVLLSIVIGVLILSLLFGWMVGLVALLIGILLFMIPI